MGRGRPKKDKYDIESMVKKVYEYTNETEVPILKDCCLKNEWNYDYVMQLQREHPELSQSIRRLLDTNEVAVVRKLLDSKIPPSTGIFMLKQHGWKDNPEPMIVNNVIQDNTGGNRSEKLKYVDKDVLAQLDDLYSEVDRQIAEHELH